MTLFGYCTSEIDLLKELEYKGNKVSAEFSGCSQTFRRKLSIATLRPVDGLTKLQRQPEKG